MSEGRERSWGGEGEGRKERGGRERREEERVKEGERWR